MVAMAVEADGDKGISETHSVELAATRRVVLLGVSNLTRAISIVVETARQVWGSSIDVFAALGHGRSYGMQSSVLGRTLPGITDCGLWAALGQRSSVPTAALMTDIGNDILYGAPAEQIVKWTEWCIDQMQKVTARIVMTELPLCNLSQLSPWRFRFFRSILFPSCRLDFDTVIQRVYELNKQLSELSARRGITKIEPKGEWYGWDPIHIKMRHCPLAWREILATWLDDPSLPRAYRRSLRRWLYLHSLAPESRWMFGLQQQCRQPAGKLADGTSISLY